MLALISLNKSVVYLVVTVCAAVFAVLIYKIIRVVADRLGYYGALKKYCKQNGGEIKKNSLYKSFFKVYPGYDIEMTTGGVSYGIKFFPKYLKNKNLLIESETKACILKNTGVMGISWRGSLPGVRTLTPDVISEVIGHRIKIDLTGADPEYKNILIFSPKCKRIYYVKKAERDEAYNGDDVFGFTVFYNKNNLIESFLDNEK
ncbi:MAG: hypothetical protein IJT49_03505 [Clostridia bacterium]|nr:hypothetical protein [Clostridia bacterium]